MNHVEHEALKFAQSIKFNSKKTTLEKFIIKVSKKGYIVKTYAESRSTLITFGLFDESKEAPSVSTVDNHNIPFLFVDNRLPKSNQLFALAHEIGHIVLEHKSSHKTKKEQEDEANLFAHHLLSSNYVFIPKSILFTLLTQVICFITILSLTIFTNHSQKTVPTNATAPHVSEYTISDDPNTYYWTTSGTVFHSDRNCYHIKNCTTVRSGTLSEAQEEKERLCKTCDKNNIDTTKQTAE